MTEHPTPRRRVRTTRAETPAETQAAAVPVTAATDAPKVAQGEESPKIATVRVLPLMPSGESVLYPLIVMPFGSRDERLLQIINAAVADDDKQLALFSQKPGSQTAEGEPTDPATLRPIGTICQVARMIRLPDGSIQALIQGQNRARLVAVEQTEPFIRAQVEVLEETVSSPDTVDGAQRHLLNLFQKAIRLSPNLPELLGQEAAQIKSPGALADLVAANLNLNAEERYEVLSLVDVSERLRRVSVFVNREIEILEIGSKIQTEIQGEMEKNQREFYLRQQLKAIQRELGETDERAAELDDLRSRLAAASLPEEARKEAEREMTRLEGMPAAAPEASVIKTYLELIISLPWNVSTEDNLDIGRAQEILDEDHYDLEKVKDRLLDYLAVRKLRPEMKGPILCLAGPPGVGKTSLGRSIARALGRKFIRLSLGGVRDEAEIRGHRRTYIGAMPGRIIQEIRRAGSNNPVMMLDEIDKLGMDYRGDPTSALLEVLDPEQNYSFADHYLDVPFDLSKVLFITTANQLDPIPGPLRDRMEIIQIPGYTELDKLNIARRYLVPKQQEENGLTSDQIEFTDEALRKIIRNFTRESGVRTLERTIGTVCRKIARKVAEGETQKHVIDEAAVSAILGKDEFRFEVAEKHDEIGVATGLAWTPVGGDVLFIEAVATPGRGGLQLTGKLGDVMKESAQAALTWARSKAGDFKVPADWFNNHDLHIHVPAGAIPKDGPSAGITMAMAMLSVMSGRPVDSDTAMTGEITLRGKVMPVGGIKEKVMAAHRAGAKRVVLPAENERDWEDVPEEVRNALSPFFVSHADEAVPLILEPVTSPNGSKPAKGKAKLAKEPGKEPAAAVGGKSSGKRTGSRAARPAP